MSIIFSSLNGAKRRALFITLVVLLSLMAGMVGSYFASSFDFVLFGLGTVNEVTPDYNAKASVIIREAKNVVVTQNEQVQQTAASFRNNSLVIVKKITKPANESEKYYSLTKPFAEAMPVTTDGWLVTNLRGKFKKDPFKASDFIILDKNKNQFNIDRVIKDDKEGLYYLHIKSSDLALYKSNESNNVVGLTVLAANHEGSVVTANLTNIVNGTGVDFSDNYDRQLVFDKKIDQNFSTLLSLSGEFIGFVNQDGQIVSSQTIISSVNSILKFGSIKRAALGVYCQDLASLVAIDGKKVSTEGCLVFNGKELPVIQGSAAEKAGVKSGDVVTAINQESASNGLSSHVSQYLPGDKVTLSLNRNGVSQDIEIVLTEKK